MRVRFPSVKGPPGGGGAGNNNNNSSSNKSKGSSTSSVEQQDDIINTNNKTATSTSTTTATATEDDTNDEALATSSVASSIMSGSMEGRNSQDISESEVSATTSSTNNGAGENGADIDNLGAAVGDEVDDDGHAGQHPQLRHMCVVDCTKSCRIVPNGPPASLDNECFEGRVMLLVRTPDVDDGSSTHGMDARPLQVSEYFKTKKRRFEFQFQFKLKKIPTGPLFLGCELEHPIKVGTLTKGLVGILLAMVRRINPGFHYSWGPQEAKLDPAQRAAGNYEKTHLSFPVEASMDRVVITKPGEELPVLGHELLESNESVKRRRKMGVGSIDWNLHDTYSMCLWSAYADWIKWRSLNVPGVSPFSLSRVTGAQPIYLSVYEISDCSAVEYRRRRPPHTRNALKVYTRLEFSNVHTTRGGLAERLFGIRAKPAILSSEMSLPDTESVDSDFEARSAISRVTMF